MRKSERQRQRSVHDLSPCRPQPGTAAVERAFLGTSNAGSLNQHSVSCWSNCSGALADDCTWVSGCTRQLDKFLSCMHASSLHHHRHHHHHRTQQWRKFPPRVGNGQDFGIRRSSETHSAQTRPHNLVRKVVFQ